MVRQSDLTHKIQIASNRLRCPDCNSDGAHFVYLLADDIRFRSFIGKVNIDSPIYIRKGKFRTVMGLNKGQVIVPGRVLIRACTQCGNTRKVGIPNN